MKKVFSKLRYQFKSGLRHGFKNVVFSKFFFGFVASLSMIISSYDKADRVKDNLNARFHDQEDTFDFVIVGAGTAGCLLANRLSEDHKVLLIEAGGEPHPLLRIPGLALFMVNYKETDWQSTTVPQRRACFACPNKRASISQGRNLGGSSNINWQVFLRGSPRDYNYWAQITGDTSWSYQEMMPYFKKSENYIGETPDREAHGFEGEIMIDQPAYSGMSKEFIRAGQELGYEHVDLNARYEQGFDTVYSPIEGGERKSSFQALLEPVRDRENLVIRKYSHATKVLVRGFDSTAFGVEYKRHGMKKYAYATKEVILSAGAIESAKLLMLSGIGPGTQLADLGIPIIADLPVGQNLQDHLSTFLGPFFVDPPRSFLIDRDISLRGFYEYKSDGHGPLASSLFQAAALISSHQLKSYGTWNWPDIQLLFSGMGAHKTFPKDLAHAFNLNIKSLKRYYEHAIGRDSFFIAVAAARPHGRGEVLLEKKDPYAPPAINPRYLENDMDMQTMISGVKVALQIVENTTSFQSLRARFTNRKFPGCDHVPFRSDEYWECYIRHYSVSMNDVVGTCSMGSPNMGVRGVVTSKLEVIGVNHLRVIDASIMPKIVASPTAAAVIAIAEKGADLILEAWKSREGMFHTMPVPSITTLPPGGEANNIDPNYGPPPQNNPPPEYYGPPMMQPQTPNYSPPPPPPSNGYQTSNGPPMFNNGNNNNNEPNFSPPPVFSPPPPLPPQNNNNDNNNIQGFQNSFNQATNNQPTFGGLPSSTDLPPAPFDSMNTNSGYGAPSNGGGYDQMQPPPNMYGNPPPPPPPGGYKYNDDGSINFNENNNVPQGQMPPPQPPNFGNPLFNTEETTYKPFPFPGDIRNLDSVPEPSTDNPNLTQDPIPGDPPEENAPFGSNTNLAYETTTPYYDAQATDQSSTTIVTPSSTKTTTMISTTTKDQQGNPITMSQEVSNVYQNTPNNLAQRPKVNFINHDTKKRPGVQISNPHPDLYYNNLSPTNPSGLASLVNLPHHPLGPVYFRNPEYVLRDTIAIKMGGSTAATTTTVATTSQRPPTLTLTDFVENQVAQSIARFTTIKPTVTSLSEYYRKLKPEARPSPNVLYKALGVTNKIPSTANVPDIYYKIMDTTSTDVTTFNNPLEIPDFNDSAGDQTPATDNNHFTKTLPKTQSQQQQQQQLQQQQNQQQQQIPNASDYNDSLVSTTNSFWVNNSPPGGNNGFAYQQSTKPPTTHPYWTNNSPDPDPTTIDTIVGSGNTQNSFFNNMRPPTELQSHFNGQTISQNFFTNSQEQRNNILQNTNNNRFNNNNDNRLNNNNDNRLNNNNDNRLNNNNDNNRPNNNNDNRLNNNNDNNRPSINNDNNGFNNNNENNRPNINNDNNRFNNNDNNGFNNNNDNNRLNINNDRIRFNNNNNNHQVNNIEITHTDGSPRPKPKFRPRKVVKIKADMVWTTRATSTTTTKPYSVSKQTHVQTYGVAQSANDQSYQDQGVTSQTIVPSGKPFVQPYWPGPGDEEPQFSSDNNDLYNDRKPKKLIRGQTESPVNGDNAAEEDKNNNSGNRENDSQTSHSDNQAQTQYWPPKRGKPNMVIDTFVSHGNNDYEYDQHVSSTTHPPKWVTTVAPAHSTFAVNLELTPPKNEEEGRLKALANNIKKATKGLWNAATGVFSGSPSADDTEESTSNQENAYEKVSPSTPRPYNHVPSPDHSTLIKNAIEFAHNPVNFKSTPPEFFAHEKPGIFERPPFHIDPNLPPPDFPSPSSNPLNTQIPDDIYNLGPQSQEYSTTEQGQLDSNEIVPPLTPPPLVYPNELRDYRPMFPRPETDAQKDATTHTYNDDEKIPGLVPPEFSDGEDTTRKPEYPEAQNYPDTAEVLSKFAANLNLNPITQNPPHPLHVEIKTHDMDLSTTPRPFVTGFSSTTEHPNNNDHGNGNYFNKENNNRNQNRFKDYDKHLHSFNGNNFNNNFNKGSDNNGQNEFRNNFEQNTNGRPLGPEFQGSQNQETFQNSPVDTFNEKNPHIDSGAGVFTSEVFAVPLPPNEGEASNGGNPDSFTPQDKNPQNGNTENNRFPSFNNENNKGGKKGRFNGDLESNEYNYNEKDIRTSTEKYPDYPGDFNSNQNKGRFPENNNNFNNFPQNNNNNPPQSTTENYSFPSTVEPIVGLPQGSNDDFTSKLKTIGNLLSKAQSFQNQDKNVFQSRPSVDNNFYKNLDPFDVIKDNLRGQSIENFQPFKPSNEQQTRAPPNPGSHYDKNAHKTKPPFSSEERRPPNPTPPPFGARIPNHQRNKNIFNLPELINQFDTNGNQDERFGNNNQEFKQNGNENFKNFGENSKSKFRPNENKFENNAENNFKDQKHFGESQNNFEGSPPNFGENQNNFAVPPPNFGENQNNFQNNGPPENSNINFNPNNDNDKFRQTPVNNFQPGPASTNFNQDEPPPPPPPLPPNIDDFNSPIITNENLPFIHTPPIINDGLNVPVFEFGQESNNFPEENLHQTNFNPPAQVSYTNPTNFEDNFDPTTISNFNTQFPPEITTPSAVRSKPKEYDLTTDPDTVDITTESSNHNFNLPKRFKVYDITSDPDTVDITADDDDQDFPDRFNVIRRNFVHRRRKNKPGQKGQRRRRIRLMRPHNGQNPAGGGANRQRNNPNQQRRRQQRLRPGARRNRNQQGNNPDEDTNVVEINRRSSTGHGEIAYIEPPARNTNTKRLNQNSKPSNLQNNATKPKGSNFSYSNQTLMTSESVTVPTVHENTPILVSSPYGKNYQQLPPRMTTSDASKSNVVPFNNQNIPQSNHNPVERVAATPHGKNYQQLPPRNTMSDASRNNALPSSNQNIPQSNNNPAVRVAATPHGKNYQQLPPRNIMSDASKNDALPSSSQNIPQRGSNGNKSVRPSAVKNNTVNNEPTYVHPGFEQFTQKIQRPNQSSQKGPSPTPVYNNAAGHPYVNRNSELPKSSQPPTQTSNSTQQTTTTAKSKQRNIVSIKNIEIRKQPKVSLPPPQLQQTHSSQTNSLRPSKSEATTTPKTTTTTPDYDEQAADYYEKLQKFFSSFYDQNPLMAEESSSNSQGISRADVNIPPPPPAQKSQRPSNSRSSQNSSPRIKSDIHAQRTSGSNNGRNRGKENKNAKENIARVQPSSLKGDSSTPALVSSSSNKNNANSVQQFRTNKGNASRNNNVSSGRGNNNYNSSSRGRNTHSNSSSVRSRNVVAQKSSSSNPQHSVVQPQSPSSSNSYVNSHLQPESKGLPQNNARTRQRPESNVRNKASSAESTSHVNTRPKLLEISHRNSKTKV